MLSGRLVRGRWTVRRCWGSRFSRCWGCRWRICSGGGLRASGRFTCRRLGCSVIMASSCWRPGSGRTSRYGCVGPMTGSLRNCWLRWVPRSRIPSTLEVPSGERRPEVDQGDIAADLNDGAKTGHLGTVLGGDEDAAAVWQVVDLVPGGDGIIVHLRLLPGLVDEYRALVNRALAS